MRYQSIIIDTLNLLYRVRESKVYKPSPVNKKVVYKDLFVDVIEFISYLKDTYLAEDGIIYLAKDFSYSTDGSSGRNQKKSVSLERSRVSADYKMGRKQEKPEFYNTLDLIKYYYLVNKPCYVNLQIQGKEADDLVKPLLDFKCKDQRVLLVTNDYDWTRYLSDKTDWLPHLHNKPETVQNFIDAKGYYPTEQTVTIYKAIFGDKSDNIPGLLTESAINKDHLLPYLKPEVDVADIIRLSTQSEMLKTNPVFEAVQKKNGQFRINIQLISAAEVSENHLESVLCYGRDSQVLVEAVETAVGIRSRKSTPVFGCVGYK